MALPDWIVAMLLRPGETLVRTQTEERTGHGWILLCIITLQAVIARYSPGGGEVATDMTVMIVAALILIQFDLEALLLYAAARLLGWHLGWLQATRFVGLAWTIFLVETVVEFYPSLVGQNQIVLWLGVPFYLWYLGVFSSGVKRLAGLSRPKAFLLALAATLPMQGLLFYLNWQAVMPQA